MVVQRRRGHSNSLAPALVRFLCDSQSISLTAVVRYLWRSFDLTQGTSEIPVMTGVVYIMICSRRFLPSRCWLVTFLGQRDRSCAKFFVVFLTSTQQTSKSLLSFVYSSYDAHWCRSRYSDFLEGAVQDSLLNSLSPTVRGRTYTPRRFGSFYKSWLLWAKA